MKKWMTETRLYEITEISKKSKEIYHMKATGKEVAEWCKMKNDAYGYVDGVGGDRSYSCYAVLMTF